MSSTGPRSCCYRRVLAEHRNDLPPAVVKDLIALGGLDESPSATRAELLARLKPVNRDIYIGWNHWNVVAETLSELDLRNLVRGLTAAELELGWYGGFSCRRDLRVPVLRIPFS